MHPARTRTRRIRMDGWFRLLRTIPILTLIVAFLGERQGTWGYLLSSSASSSTCTIHRVGRPSPFGATSTGTTRGTSNVPASPANRRNGSVRALPVQASSSSSAAATTTTTTSTKNKNKNKKNNIYSLQQRKALHEMIRKVDPEWYKEYVLDILGEEEVYSKWPAVALPDHDEDLSNNVENNIEETTETLESKQQLQQQQQQQIPEDDPGASTTDTPQSSSRPEIQSQEAAFSASWNKKTSSTTSSSVLKAPPSDDKDSSANQNDKVPAIISMTVAIDDTNQTAPAIVNNTNGGQTIQVSNSSTIIKTAPTSIVGLNESSIAPTVSSSTMNISTVLSTPTTAATTTTNNSTTTPSDTIITAKTPDPKNLSSDASASPSSLNTTNLTNKTRISPPISAAGVAIDSAKKKNQSVVEPLTSLEKQQSNAAENAKSTTANVTISGTTSANNIPTARSSTKDESVSSSTNNKTILYREAKQGWKMVNLSVLTNLGYLEGEVTELLPDAVAIIVQDQIRRPRATLGLPAPWKVGPTNTRTSDQRQAMVQIVANEIEAKERIQKLQEQEPVRSFNKRSPPTPSTVGRTLPPVTRIKPPATSSKAEVPDRNESSSTERTSGAELSSKATSRSSATNNSSIKSPAVAATEDEDEDDTQDSSLKVPTADGKSPKIPDQDNTRLGESNSKIIETKQDKVRIPTAAADKRPTVTATTSTNPSDMKAKKDGNQEDEADERVILYKDIGKTLVLVPLANVTRLGYQVEEIQALQGEALAIIVADQISRPRMGIPPQWKLADPISSGKSEIEFVDTLEEAETRVEAEKMARRRRQTVESESTKAAYRSRQVDTDGITDEAMPRENTSDPKRPMSKEKQSNEPQLSSNEKRTGRASRRQSREEDDAVIRRPKSSAAGTLEDSRDGKRSRSSRKVEEDDSEGRRRSRRDKINEDGSPKRIYNARTIPNRREQDALPDPPDPNSPIWMDMGTFRDLLRSEAELRLRILGDDWAPTVKQESDWRLNLYKNWLWTLHNGVGESIVPPSRYERARKTKERRQQDEVEEPTLSGGRSSSRKTPPRKRRPKGDM